MQYQEAIAIRHVISDSMRAYLLQIRQETGLRMCDKIFDTPDGKPNKVCCAAMEMLFFCMFLVTFCTFSPVFCCILSPTLNLKKTSIIVNKERDFFIYKNKICCFSVVVVFFQTPIHGQVSDSSRHQHVIIATYLPWCPKDCSYFVIR